MGWMGTTLVLEQHTQEAREQTTPHLPCFHPPTKQITTLGL